MTYKLHSKSHQIISYGADHCKSFAMSLSNSMHGYNPSKEDLKVIMDLYKIKTSPHLSFYVYSIGFAINPVLYLFGRHSFSSCMFMLSNLYNIIQKNRRVLSCNSIVWAIIPLERLSLKYRKAIIEYFNCDTKLFEREYKKYKSVTKIIDNIPTKYITKTFKERARYTFANSLMRFYMVNNFPHFKQTITDYYRAEATYKSEIHELNIETLYKEFNTIKKNQRAIKRVLSTLERDKLKSDLIDYFETKILSKGIDRIELSDFYALTTDENLHAMDDFYKYLEDILFPLCHKFPKFNGRPLLHLYATYDLYKRGYIPPFVFKIYLLGYASYLKHTLEDYSTDYKYKVLKDTLNEFKANQQYPLSQTPNGRKFLKLFYQFIFGDNGDGLLNFRDFAELYYIRYNIVEQILLDNINGMYRDDFLEDKKVKPLMDTLNQYITELEQNI